MSKYTLLLITMWCTLTVGAVAQINCTSSTKLVCQIPFATGQTGSITPEAQADAVAFNASIATQLTQLPLQSSSSGILFVFNKQLGVDQPLENLGPILTDRAPTIGKNRLFVGFSFQLFDFNSIDGIGLGRVPYVYQATSGNVSQYIQETERIAFKVNQYVILATYGLTNKTDVSVIMPFERISIGTGPASIGNQYFVGPAPTYAQLGIGPVNQPYVAGIASGIGDVLFNVKQVFVKGERLNASGGFLFRVPSGDALNYLGSGAYGFNPYAVLSYQFKPWIAAHARIGYQWNTNTVLIPEGTTTSGSSRLPGGFQYALGADTKVVKNLTLAADFLGNQFLNSPAITLGTSNIPGYNLNLPSVSKATESYTINDFSIGLKWSPFGSHKSAGGGTSPLQGLLLYGNALFQMNDTGLRSDPVPLVGISYNFRL
jgi:hypothetical protein